MNNLYLGWANPRKAWGFNDLPIIILQCDRGTCILKGTTALAFHKALEEVLHHHTGVKNSADVAALMLDLPHHPHDHPVFNFVFDSYFEPDPELEPAT